MWAFQLLFELFYFNGIFSSPLFWHSHLIGLGHDCQIFKILLQHSETGALVQGAFEFKRATLFVVAKIGQTNLVKSREIQGSQLSSSWNFEPCFSSPKIPQIPFSIYF